MLRKTFVFILLSIAMCASVFGQDVAPGQGKTTTAFSMFFDGDGSYLGVQSVEVTKENFSRYGLRDVRGVAVEKVIEGSPAQTAGLQEGDVIVKFNGEGVTSTRKLSRLIREVAPDHQAKLTVFRNGDDCEITVTLGKRPTPKFGDGAFSMTVPRQMGKLSVPPMPPMADLPLLRTYPGYDRDVLIFRGASGRRIGVSVTTLTKQLSDHFGVGGGVLVNNVRENSPAAKAGLKAGDIIVEVEGKEVKSDLDLVRAITEKKDGSVQVTIVRDKNRQTISVTPEEAEGGFDTFFEIPEGGLTPPAKTKIARPATPVPLNQLYRPGRVL